MVKSRSIKREMVEEGERDGVDTQPCWWPAGWQVIMYCHGPCLELRVIYLTHTRERMARMLVAGKNPEAGHCRPATEITRRR